VKMKAHPRSSSFFFFILLTISKTFVMTLIVRHSDFPSFVMLHSVFSLLGN
jgi:hypothetical protein